MPEPFEPDWGVRQPPSRLADSFRAALGSMLRSLGIVAVVDGPWLDGDYFHFVLRPAPGPRSSIHVEVLISIEEDVLDERGIPEVIRVLRQEFEREPPVRLQWRYRVSLSNGKALLRRRTLT